MAHILPPKLLDVFSFNRSISKIEVEYVPYLTNTSIIREASNNLGGRICAISY
jgi:hypothetical protein